MILDEALEVPRCGRGFVKRNQWHSCLVTSIDQHFAGVDPALRKTYEALVGRLKVLGPFRVEL